MKKFIYLMCVLSTSILSAQDISFTFENAEITNDGTDDFYEVDVMVSSTADLQVGNGILFINYNTDAFGMSASNNGAADFVVEPAGILNETIWMLNTVDNSVSRLAHVNFQLAPPTFYGPGETITTTPSLYIHLRIRYLPGQAGVADPGVSFETDPIFTGETFTPCGGNFGADCIGFPGMVIADSFDSSGATLPATTTTSTYTTAGGWDNGLPADATVEAIITENYDTSLGNIIAGSLTVQSGATLTIGAGEYISVENNITVDNGATLDVLHQGAVVQIEDAAVVSNNGTINVGVTTPELMPRDFVIVGSPMTAPTREGDFSQATTVRNHDTSLFVPNAAVATQFPMAENFADDNNDNFIDHSGVLNAGEGYFLRPRAISAVGNEAASYTFSEGTLNNGVVNQNLIFQVDQNSSFNLLSNPYPSAINVDTFLDANPEIGEVYYWEHIQAPSTAFAGALSQNFSMEDISLYNMMGGMAAASDITGTTAPNQFMATAQGFAVKASAAGTAVFNNSMRVVGNNNTLRSTETGVDRIWLTITNSTLDIASSALVGFTDNATAGLDFGYDSNRIATQFSLYSHLEDGSLELGIQGREAFATDKVVPMGFTTTIAENTGYEISIADLEGEGIENAEVYLVDRYLNTTHNLSKAAYTFTSVSGVNNNRFELQFKDANVLSTDDVDALSASLSFFPNPTKGILNITSREGIDANVTVLDLNNRVVLSPAEMTGSSLQLDLSAISTGVYFVQIQTTNGVSIERIIKE